MHAETIAEKVAAELRENPYFLDVQIHTTGDFPSIEFWNDRVQITEVIVCYATPDDAENARAFANARARVIQQDLEAEVDGPVDVLANIVTADYEIMLLE